MKTLSIRDLAAAAFLLASSAFCASWAATPPAVEGVTIGMTPAQADAALTANEKAHGLTCQNVYQTNYAATNTLAWQEFSCHKGPYMVPQTDLYVRIAYAAHPIEVEDVVMRQRLTLQTTMEMRDFQKAVQAHFGKPMVTLPSDYGSIGLFTYGQTDVWDYDANWNPKPAGTKLPTQCDSKSYVASSHFDLVGRAAPNLLFLDFRNHPVDCGRILYVAAHAVGEVPPTPKTQVLRYEMLLADSNLVHQNNVYVANAQKNAAAQRQKQLDQQSAKRKVNF